MHPARRRAAVAILLLVGAGIAAIGFAALAATGNPTAAPAASPAPTASPAPGPSPGTSATPATGPVAAPSPSASPGITPSASPSPTPELPRIVRTVCTDRICGGCDGKCSRNGGHVAVDKRGHCACTPTEGSPLDRATRMAYEKKQPQ